jgi:microcystin degradation protein MlrC
MARIAVGGMQHETNTFAPSKATYTMFEQGGGWPGVCSGQKMLDSIAGANIPAEGAVKALRTAGHQVIPLTWAAASPSAQVTDDAFERIVGSLTEGLKAAIASGGIEAVYLDLHGAMVTDSFDDGEAEILRRVREIIGPRTPLVASLDSHANVSREMVDYADALSIYRTYPHVDMAETGARAIGLLLRMLKTGMAFQKAFTTFNFLTGLPSQCTFREPARGIYSLLEKIEEQSGVALSFATGFPMADIEVCGMSVVGYGDKGKVDAAVAELAAAINACEKDFEMELLTPEDAVRRAMAKGEIGAPVVLADTQDNPGAGGNGDTTGLLRAMLAQRAQDACLGLLIDGPSALRAHEAGQGTSLDFELGEISGIPGTKPLGGRFTVERLGDGKFTCTGPMFKGFNMTLGPMALLRQDGVRVLVASRKCQAGDQEMFRHLGVEPIRQRIVAVKSSVHFRADFEPIAKEVLVVRAPGPALADPTDFKWTKLRKGLRLKPLGPVFA